MAKSSQPSRKKFWKSRKSLFSALAALVLIGGAAVYAGMKRSDPSLGDIATAKVTRGRFIVSVSESGDLKAADETIIVNELRWPATIQYVVPEGTNVTKGQVIIRFECQQLLDTIDQVQLDVSHAQDESTQADGNLQVAQKQTAHDVQAAKDAVTQAKMDLEEFEQHQAAQQLNNAQAQVNLAEQNLELAQAKLDFMNQVNADKDLKGTYSANEIKAQQLQVETLNLTLENAKSTVVQLTKYDIPKDRRQYESAVTDAELKYEEVQIQSQANLKQAEGDAKSSDLRLKMQQRRLANLMHQKDCLEIRADRPGLIVYDTNTPRWDPNPPRVAEGSTINPRTRLMVIPNMSTIQVETKVYEGLSQDVHIGTPALITMDSRPGETFVGHVIKKAVLPSSQNAWLNPSLKVFPVTVAFDELPKGLKPNMSVNVQLFLEEIPNVVQVPIAAVYTQLDETFCWKLVNGVPVRTLVKIGRTNQTHAEVLSGLDVGDTVLLSPPPGQDIGPMLRQRQKNQKVPAPAPASQPASPATMPASTQPATAPAATQPASSASSQPAQSPPSR